MIDKLKKHEKAWTEFVHWATAKRHWVWSLVDLDNWAETSANIVRNEFTDRELRSLLIEFLDSKGIYIGIIGAENGYLCTIAVPEPHNDLGYSCNSRPEAEEQGIIKAFEILNQRGEK